MDDGTGGTAEGQESPSAEDEALARAVHAVYAAPPDRFVATRKEWVATLRAEGLRGVAKQVSVLRKPSVSAAAVNALVRAEDPVVDRLQDVGARMRHAQSTLDAAALSALRDERDGVLAAWVAAAREHSDGTLTATVEAEVRDTAVAALADPAATEVATSGTLTRALSYSGFGEVDVADAVARTSTGVVLSRIEGGRGRAEAADGPTDDDEDEDVVEDEKVPEDEEVPDDEPAEEASTEETEEQCEDEGDHNDEEAEVEAGDADAETPEDEEADLDALEMELDEAEKVVAAARAARRTAAEEHAAAQERMTEAAGRLKEAERLLEQARAASEEAEAEQDRTAAALEEAEQELRRSRRHRDDARAALEEAEDR